MVAMWFRVRSYLSEYDLSHVLSLFQSIIYFKYDKDGGKTDMWMFTTSENVKDVGMSSGLLITEEDSPPAPGVAYLLYPKNPGEPINFNVSHLYGYGINEVVLVIDRTMDVKGIIEIEIDKIELKKRGKPVTMAQSFLDLFGIKPTVSASEVEMHRILKRKLGEGPSMRYQIYIDLPLKTGGWNVKRIKVEKLVGMIQAGEVDRLFRGIKRRWGVATINEMASFTKLPPYAELEWKPVTAIKASKASEVPEEYTRMFYAQHEEEVIDEEPESPPSSEEG